MDGTIYLDDHLLPGAKRMIEQLRTYHIPVRYLSNNPTKDPRLYIGELERLGLPTGVSEVANTVVTVTKRPQEHYPEATTLPVAEPPLVSTSKTAGIKLSEDPAEIDTVVASHDRTFDYRKLRIAFGAIWSHKRAKPVVTSPDRYRSFLGGRGESDCVATIAAIEVYIQCQYEVVVGKPNRRTLVEALTGLDVKLENCLVVDDRLGTNIQIAVKAGIDSTIPLTGDSVRQEAETLDPKDQPTHLLDRMDRLIPAGTREEPRWIDNSQCQPDQHLMNPTPKPP